MSRVDALDHFRTQRALAANSPQFEQVFSLLPLLIHTNLPELPAYIKNAPSGIAAFELSEYQANYLSELSLSHL
ncbi:hypothetical protein GUF71_10650, partial [Xanthomonas citri pv. citri]|nr:hypothetical protein [Xanthomonas citri pv. citri]